MRHKLSQAPFQLRVPPEPAAGSDASGVLRISNDRVFNVASASANSSRAVCSSHPELEPANWRRRPPSRAGNLGLGPMLTQTPYGCFAPWLHARPLGYGERLLVVRFCLGKAEVTGEVAEDLGDGPQGRKRVGPGWPSGERQQVLVGGFGAVSVMDGGGEQAADTGPEQPKLVSGDRVWLTGR